MAFNSLISLEQAECSHLYEELQATETDPGDTDMCVGSSSMHGSV